MLLVYTGLDYQRSNGEATQMVKALQKKQPDAQLVEVSDNADLETNLRSLANDQGLFFRKSLVKIGRLFPDKNNEALVKDLLPILQESESVFVWVEPDLNKIWLKRLDKEGVKVTVNGESAKQEKQYQAFAVSDAFLARDRKKLWLSIKDSQVNQLDAENVFGTLWWQVKTALIAKQYDNAKAAGLSQFVYRKSRTTNWTKEELQSVAGDLLLAQKASREFNSLDLWVELEAWALALR